VSALRAGRHVSSAWRSLYGTLAEGRAVWRMHNQLSDKPALARCLGRQKISSIAPVLMKIAKEPDDGYTCSSLRQEQQVCDAWRCPAAELWRESFALAAGRTYYSSMQVTGYRAAGL